MSSSASETRLRRQGPETRVSIWGTGVGSRHNAGTRPWNQAAVPMVRAGANHQGFGPRASSRASETEQAASGSARGPPRGVPGNGRAGMDDDRAAWMCGCLTESRLRERPGTSESRKEPSRITGWGCMERPKRVLRRERRARALIKPRSESGQGKHSAGDGKQDIKAS